MGRMLLSFCCAGLLLASVARGFDWNTDLPFDIGFHIGFDVHAVPGADDQSEALGLVVCADEIITDKKSTLMIRGTIVNAGSETVEGVSMGFAVTSYAGIGTDRSTAHLDSSVIPPGGSSGFTMRVVLGNELPRWAMYTVRGTKPLSEQGEHGEPQPLSE